MTDQELLDRLDDVVIQMHDIVIDPEAGNGQRIDAANAMAALAQARMQSAVI